jgi:hypothetical protein
MIFPSFMQLNAAMPLPAVRGPLPVAADSYPFGAADHTRMPTDLKKIGYIEEEFLAEGKANVYAWPERGTAVVRTANALYTTRVLVRRPASKSKFSGNVIVEMLNPSNMFDLNIGWAISHDQFVRSGDAWVGITAKPVSVVALKNFNPKRYADLSFANPLPLDDPKNCSMVARDSGKPVLDKFGNVIGGVRSPYVDVPTSAWFGSSTGESFCFIAGHEVPFDRAQLKKLYPNHKAYVNAVEQNLSSLVTQRFVTKTDAKTLLKEARKAEIP